MPTTRPRYVLTETDELAQALEHAAQRWPKDAKRPSRLLLRLVEAGDEAIGRERKRTRERRKRAIERTSGQFTGMYPRGSIERLRREWPA
jgi:hypothetical protein